jgi:hypothetical protein
MLEAMRTYNQRANKTCLEVYLSQVACSVKKSGYLSQQSDGRPEVY